MNRVHSDFRVYKCRSFRSIGDYLLTTSFLVAIDFPSATKV